MGRLCSLACAVCAYVVASACEGIIVPPWPGLNLTIHMNPSRVGQFNAITATWSGNLMGSSTSGGLTTATDSRTINRSAQSTLIDFNTRNLALGEWDLVARVRDGSSSFINLRCCQTIFSGKTVMTTFTEGQPSCTCDMGCRACP